MDISKPIKRRMKIRREGGDWIWINFKYECLSTFRFICGLLGHSERDCTVAYANPNKIIEKAYGTWLRAPVQNGRNQNIGARWLKNGGDYGKSGIARTSTTTGSGDDDGGARVAARFMEVDGHVGEILGDDGRICYVSRGLGNKSMDMDTPNTEEGVQGGNNFDSETIVLDSKRKCVDNTLQLEEDGPVIQLANVSINGPKHFLEAGPGTQARLEK